MVRNAGVVGEQLAAWAVFADRYWVSDPGDPTGGWFGTGYNNWGVQTNQKYLAAMAALAVLGGESIDREWAYERAVAALRFSVRSHLSGPGACSDGTRWGHTWISALGIERMMYGVDLLGPQLEGADLAGIERVLVSEADWLLTDHARAGQRGVFGDPWAHSGKNAPESNIWNGALLWRTAVRVPDHPNADAWRERALEFLINGVSVAADASDERIVDGEPIRERFRGANFFPNYALDHHGYLNVGYQVICASNAAILHFDLSGAGLSAPEALHHHQRDLWAVLRRVIFADGRLARIGGDSRVRYTYCQEYLLPTLLYAADQHGDAYAAGLLDAQLRLIETEQKHNGDGSFYGRRLAGIEHSSAYYYTRLEADRACALGMVAAYLPRTTFPEPAAEPYETSVAGDWSEPEHGAALHRSPRRLASFSWRAYGLTQGMCLPPDAGDLAEWQLNLAPELTFLGDARTGGKLSRELVRQRVQSFAGGFLTTGLVNEGVSLTIAEGWSGGPAATTYLAVAALPDDRTMIGIQVCRAANWWPYLQSLKGLHLNIPNDLYNGFRRQITTESGERTLTSPADADTCIDLGGNWLTVDGRLGVIGLYGASGLTIDRSATPRGGTFASLAVDEVCYPSATTPTQLRPNETFLDIGWAVLSDAAGPETASFTDDHRRARIDLAESELRGLKVTGADGQPYVLLANLGGEPRSADLRLLLAGRGPMRDLATGEQRGDVVDVPAWGGVLLGPS